MDFLVRSHVDAPPLPRAPLPRTRAVDPADMDGFPFGLFLNVVIEKKKKLYFIKELKDAKDQLLLGPWTCKSRTFVCRNKIQARWVFPFTSASHPFLACVTLCMKRRLYSKASDELVLSVASCHANPSNGLQPTCDGLTSNHAIPHRYIYRHTASRECLQSVFRCDGRAQPRRVSWCKCIMKINDTSICQTRLFKQ